MPSKSSYSAANGKTSFFMTEEYSITCTCVCVCVCVYTYVYHIFFIHSSVDGHLGETLMLCK